MKTRIISLVAVGSLLMTSGLVAQAVDAPVNSSAAVAVPSTAAPEFSGRINEVVSLVRSGVEEPVVISYIKTSPGPFQPSADEIIRLRDQGISSAVITAMLQRGAELRERAQVASANAAPAQPTATYAQAAPPTVVTPPLTYAYPAYSSTAYYSQPASSVVYIGGTYGYPSWDYCYPYYSSYYYPGFYCGPRFTFNARFGSPFFFHGGFGDFDHDRFGGFHGGGFHAVGGGFHGGFHGGGFHGGGGFRAGGGFHGGGFHR